MGQSGNDVLHAHLPTNLHPHPEGEHWVVATPLVGAAATSPDVESVRRELRTWFGETVNEWGHLATTTVRHALPQIDLNHHERFLPEIEIEGVLLAATIGHTPRFKERFRSAERIPRAPQDSHSKEDANMTWHTDEIKEIEAE